jgi:hypothetical protein
MRKAIIVRKAPSNSAKLLAGALGLARVEPGHPALLRPRKAVINWGCSDLDGIVGGAGYSLVPVLNHPTNVGLAINKIACSMVLENNSVRTVNFCSGPYSNARAKYPDDILLARYTVTGNSGKGIKILRPGDPAPAQEPLVYSVYTKKTEEYRVHVAFGKVIHVVEKRKRADAEPSADEKLVRTLGDTWVFCEENHGCDERGDRTQLHAASIAAVNALGLDFGAVDTLYSKAGEYVVCEVNTKPGIGSTSTLEAYVNAFKEKING